MVALQSDLDALGDERLEIDKGSALQAMALPELACFEDLLDSGKQAVGIGKHGGVELLALSFLYRVALKRFEVESDAGDRGLELVVTAFRKESWRSLRRISRTRKTVLRTTPAISRAKRMIPRTASATVRSLRTTQPICRVTARPTRRTPRVIKNAIVPRRRVMFMACPGNSVDSEYNDLPIHNFWNGSPSYSMAP